MDYKTFGSEELEVIKGIYAASNWTAYLWDDAKLKEAFDQSLYLLGAFDSDKLVGFVRCVGDGQHVVLVQDLIVDPAYQKQGIGTYLLKQAWQDFKEVRQFFLLTTLSDPVANHFYQELGMKKLEEVDTIGYYRI